MTREGLAARLLATFLDELDEQVRVLNADLLALESEPADRDRLTSVFRIAHTLKGAARAASVPLVEQACHALEAILADARDGRRTLDERLFATLFGAADALADAGRRLRAGEPLDASALAVAGWGRGDREASGQARRARDDSASLFRGRHDDEKPRVPIARSRGHDEERVEVGSTSSPQPAAPVVENTVRVSPHKIDALLATAGELRTSAARLQDHATALETLNDLAARWAGESARWGRTLRAAVQNTDGGPAAARAVERAERVGRQIASDVARIAVAARRDRASLASTTSELMEEVRRLRMRPFAEATEALPRLARDVARDMARDGGREVALVVEGGEVEADRVILDGMREALMHLVRNAVDHGIERPAERERLGKPRVGTIAIRAAVRGDQLVVTVADDGAGLDVPAIRAALRERGLPVPDDPAALARVLFEGGFSTRAEPTTISGRGLGLDIVQSVVERMRGTVDVAWAEGRGTTFAIEVPLTLATIRVVLVAVGPEVLALPTDAVERLLRVRVDDLRLVESRHVVTTAYGPVPVVTLARILGPPLVERAVEGRVFVVVVRVARRRLAIVVDDVLGEDDIVARPLERLARPLPHLAGAALLADGRVALVLNPAALLSTGLGRGLAGAVPLAPARAAPRRRVLVVDDSITTRTLEQSVLEAAGYDVIAAVDGADAWRVLEERGADVVVADVEMPRMDGFELTRAVRASPRFKALPVVLVTSLESEEHRARGMEAGADAYIVKSSFDQGALLDTIGQLLR